MELGMQVNFGPKLREKRNIGNNLRFDIFYAS